MKTKYALMMIPAFGIASIFSSCNKLDEFCYLLHQKGQGGSPNSTLFKIREVDVTGSNSDVTKYFFSYNKNNDITKVKVYTQSKGKQPVQYNYKIAYSGREILKVTTTSGSGNYSDNFQYNSVGELLHYVTHISGIDNRTYDLLYNSKNDVGSFGYAGEHKNADYFNYQYDTHNNIHLIKQYDFFRFIVDSFTCRYDNRMNPFHYFLKTWYAIHISNEDHPLNEDQYGPLSYYWAEATFSRHNIIRRTGTHSIQKFTNSYDNRNRLVKQVISQDIYKRHDEYILNIQYY